MSDFNSSLPVRTENNGDVVVKVGDGTTPSQQLAVDSSGKVTAKLNDGAGNDITSQANGAQQALDVGINVAGAQIDPRDIRALTSSDVVTVDQGTTPWISKDQSDGPVAPGTAASFASLGAGQYNATPPTLADTEQAALQLDSSGKLLVATTSADDHNYGTVGASTLRTAAQIGNATGAANFNFGAVGAQTLRAAAQIGNATGAADFNAGSTGAQTLRTEANQGASASAANGWFVKPTDGTNSQAYTASSEAKVSVTTALPAGTNNIGKVSIQDSSGAAFSPTNPLYVNIDTIAGTTICDYKTASAIAAAASDNHDYTVTAAKTLYLKQIEASASGKIKVEVKVETSAGSGTFLTKFVQFNSSSDPNITIHLEDAIAVAAGVKVRVTVTNRDLLSEDVYSTICGNEI